MIYSKSTLLYQDEPEYGPLLKLIVLIVPVASLAGSIYLFSSGDSTDAITLLVEAFVVGLIFWSVFPRKYQVYEDHLRIVLGRPFSVKIGFDKIKKVEVTSRLTFSINFVTKFTRDCVEIAKKRGLSIAITPKDSDLFVENANEALSQWVKTNYK
ncbi:PH domain-containing protein [Chloroflexota bacterium]